MRESMRPSHLGSHRHKERLFPLKGRDPTGAALTVWEVWAPNKGSKGRLAAAVVQSRVLRNAWGA